MPDKPRRGGSLEPRPKAGTAKRAAKSAKRSAKRSARRSVRRVAKVAGAGPAAGKKAEKSKQAHRSKKAKKSKKATRAKASAAAQEADKGGLPGGRLVPVTLIAVLVVVAFFFVIYPVSTLFDQYSQLDDVRTRQVEITEEITDIDSQIESLSGPEGTELRARCFAHYVRPGTEAYQVPGLSGCAEQP